MNSSSCSPLACISAISDFPRTRCGKRQVSSKGEAAERGTARTSAARGARPTKVAVKISTHSAKVQIRKTHLHNQVVHRSACTSCAARVYAGAVTLHAPDYRKAAVLCPVALHLTLHQHLHIHHARRHSLRVSQQF